jgi:cell division septation protein DedD
VAPAQTATVQPAAGGSARIQLAAVKTEAAAQKEWVRLQKMHPDVLGALTLHVEKFEKSASETFYRIQAGPFQDKAGAKQICAQLKQKDQACIVAN